MSNCSSDRLVTQPDTVWLTLELESEMVLNAALPNNSKTNNKGDLSPACPQLKPEECEKAEKVIASLKDGDKSISSLMVIANEKNKNRFRQQILTPLMASGVIEQTIKDVPNSPKQKYRLTGKSKFV